MSADAPQREQELRERSNGTRNIVRTGSTRRYLPDDLLQMLRLLDYGVICRV